MKSNIKLGNTSHGPGWHELEFRIDGKYYRYGCADGWYMNVIEEIARFRPGRALNNLKDAVKKGYVKLLTE